MRIVGSLTLVCVLAGASANAAVAQTPAERDVRARAEAFYSLLLAQKYRQAEPFVSADDRDTYYAMEKPQIMDFHITKFTLGKTGATAELEMSSTTRIRRPMIGEIEIPLSYLSHWKFENGNWFWYIPTDEVRQTPFGPMHFIKNSAADSIDESKLKRLIASGPTTDALRSGVKSDAQSISVGPNRGNGAVVHLQNTLPGPVTLSLSQAKDEDIEAVLSATRLSAGDKATLTVTRLSTKHYPAKHVLITVAPTQQVLDIVVR